MTNNRTILIVNDDGIQSDGIRTLARAAKAFGQVWVIAPESQRSAMSHRITCNGPVTVQRVPDYMDQVQAFACSGSPADCVRVSPMVIGRKPDVVLSGINFGYNISWDLQYSATAGAALEAAFQGSHAIAFSSDTGECHEVMQHYLHQLIAEYIDKPLSRTQIWNINFPTIPLAQCKGVMKDVRVCYDNLYRDDYAQTTVDEDTTSFQICYWNRGAGSEGTDFHGVTNGYVTVGIVNNIG